MRQVVLLTIILLAGLFDFFNYHDQIKVTRNPSERSNRGYFPLNQRCVCLQVSKLQQILNLQL